MNIFKRDRKKIILMVTNLLAMLGTLFLILIFITVLTYGLSRL